MKCKVRLSYEVEMIVEGESEDEIMDWLVSNTPQEAKDLAYANGRFVSESYEEEILSKVSDGFEADYVIEEESQWK